MKCFTCARSLRNEYPEKVSFDESKDLIMLFPAQWDSYMKNLKEEKKGYFYQHKGNLVVFMNGDKFIGTIDSFMEWAIQEFRYIDKTSSMIYNKMSNEAYKKMINDTVGRSYVYLEVTYGDVSVPEKVIIELFEDVCPITCKNFKQLCQGFKRADNKNLCYTNTYFERVVKGEFIQGGNI
jgi:peptidyl-prolyl cis-trans isomerase-like 6